MTAPDTAAVALLREIAEDLSFCPICEADRGNTREALIVHAPTCRLAAVLSSASSQDRGDAVNPHKLTNWHWKHKKRGTTYEVVGRAQVQCTDDDLKDHEVVTVYRSLDCDDIGALWVRREAEFIDGRFERIAPAPRFAPEPRAAL